MGLSKRERMVVQTRVKAERSDGFRIRAPPMDEMGVRGTEEPTMTPELWG